MDLFGMNIVYSLAHLLEEIKNFIFFYRPILLVLDQLLKSPVGGILSYDVECIIVNEILYVSDHIRMIQTLKYINFILALISFLVVIEEEFFDCIEFSIFFCFVDSPIRTLTELAEKRITHDNLGLHLYKIK